MVEVKHTPAYLVWSNEHRCWWAADRRGYTSNIDHAGRYSREEAIQIAGTARGGWQVGSNPDEIAIPEADAIEQSQHPHRYEAWANAALAKTQPPLIDGKLGVGGAS